MVLVYKLLGDEQWAMSNREEQPVVEKSPMIYALFSISHTSCPTVVNT